MVLLFADYGKERINVHLSFDHHDEVSSSSRRETQGVSKWCSKAI